MRGQHGVPLLAKDTVFGPEWGLSCIHAVYDHVMADYTLALPIWAATIKAINTAKLEVMRTRYVNA